MDNQMVGSTHAVYRVADLQLKSKKIKRIETGRKRGLEMRMVGYGWVNGGHMGGRKLLYYWINVPSHTM